MGPAVRLTRRPSGGFLLEGVETTPIEAVREGNDFAIGGAEPRRMEWSDGERGWVLRSAANGDAESGRTTCGDREALAPSTVLLADGRLFRLIVSGASAPRVELARWDGPGAYLVARAVDGGWDLTRTAAGEALEAGPELWILASAELGRLDGWW